VSHLHWHGGPLPILVQVQCTIWRRGLAQTKRRIVAQHLQCAFPRSGRPDQAVGRLSALHAATEQRAGNLAVAEVVAADIAPGAQHVAHGAGVEAVDELRSVVLVRRGEPVGGGLVEVGF